MRGLEMDAQAPEKWRPLTGMPEGAEGWATPGFADLEAEWAECQGRLKAGSPESRFLDGWLRERVRAFALETGQIEGLYTLRRGVTEQLIAEGFAGAVGSHTFEGLEDRTVRGLLEDQEAAYDMMFDDVASGRPLSAYMIKSWHALLTRHQDTVTGIDPQGRRVEVEFRGKGQWKTRPNNPRRPDGVIHEYCPPEQVEPEMRRFLDLYNDDIRHRNYPVNAEAAWLHHRFVRTHPFQDGNGRVSRQLMAWAYVKRSLPPPVVTAQGKFEYIIALEAADEGNLKAFSDYISNRSTGSLQAAVLLAKRALAGKLNRPNGNGGRTVGDQYLPPVPDDTSGGPFDP
ncbi:MAG: Fic family protein [Gammaproteobacteria bacterium]|nr:Fic family protein [Gammaproteobacteria bacterium]